MRRPYKPDSSWVNCALWSMLGAGVALAFVLILSGCALQPWCDNNPKTCAVAATVAVACVAVGTGLVVQQIHKSAVNPAPKYAPFVAAFHAADQSRKWIDTFRKEDLKK